LPLSGQKQYLYEKSKESQESQKQDLYEKSKESPEDIERQKADDKYWDELIDGDKIPDSIELMADTDGDGINDEEDKCPNVKGVRENNGCPALNFDAKDIKFAINSANLTIPSKKELDKGVVILKENPVLKLSIEGHASSTGNDKINDPLSLKRATSVKNYIVSKGVEQDRLSVVGYGSKKPVADNKTLDGRKANRRVEFKVQQ
jgi:outer membrane protein OmpA-like peptidoglycan-associated protein